VSTYLRSLTIEMRLCVAKNMCTSAFSCFSLKPFSRLHASHRVSRARQIFRVVDVGCATGTTLVALLARGFTDVHGVEASRPMLAGVRRLREKYCWEEEDREDEKEE